MSHGQSEAPPPQFQRDIAGDLATRLAPTYRRLPAVGDSQIPPPRRAQVRGAEISLLNPLPRIRDYPPKWGIAGRGGPPAVSRGNRGESAEPPGETRSRHFWPSPVAPKLPYIRRIRIVFYRPRRGFVAWDFDEGAERPEAANGRP